MDNIHLRIGLQLKRFLRGEGISQADAAKMMGISRTTLADYLNRADFPSDALQIVRTVWPTFVVVESPSQPNSTSQTKSPAPAEAEAGDEKKSSIDEELVRALIRSQNEMIEANKSHRKLTDALLDERDRRRDAQPQVTWQEFRASLDEMKKLMEHNFHHDEQVDLFLAENIAKLAKIPTEKFLEMMHRAMSDAPSGQSTSTQVENGSLSKA